MSFVAMNILYLITRAEQGGAQLMCWLWPKKLPSAVKFILPAMPHILIFRLRAADTTSHNPRLFSRCGITRLVLDYSDTLVLEAFHYA